MDTTALDITFDSQGVCNYCTEFLRRSSHIIFDSAENREESLQKLVESVKLSGKGKPYDCIVGVSGGVDSSWTLVQVKQLGLRPLAVHMDNGWNSELAQNNIANLLLGLGVDLYTHVINWDEYRQLMQAFFDADVVDVELLYDNAMLAVNYRQAAKYGLKYILAGTNVATEGVRMPRGWNWFKYDKKNICSIARRRGLRDLATFPAMSSNGFLWNRFVRGICWTSFLDYQPYNKFHALDLLEKHYGYKRYPYKHYESVFTRFYQAYILPRKFGIDKRRPHLSALVVSGQISRDDALHSLGRIPYASEAELQADLQYFLKKMNWSQQQLDDYILRPEIPHSCYPSEFLYWTYMAKLKQSLAFFRLA